MLEVTLSTLVVSLVLVSALRMSASSLLMWQEASSDVRAQNLAHDLLNELLAVSYEDPETIPPAFNNEADEPSNPADRLAFDDTDDYKNWTSDPPIRRDGSEIPNFENWERRVVIKKLDANDPTRTLGNGQPDEGIRCVTITVEDPDFNEFELVAIVSKWGAVKRATGVDTTFVTGAHLELTNNAGDRIVAGTDLTNHAEGP